MPLFSTEQLSKLSGLAKVAPPADYKLPSHFPSLRNAFRVSLDFESDDPSIGAKTGPGWRRGAYPLGIGVAIQDRDGTIPFQEYYPVAHTQGPNLDEGLVWEWLADELNFYNGEIVGANLLYEGDGLQYRNVMPVFAKWRDVQWAEALLDENSPNYQLERLSKKYLGIGKATAWIKALYGPNFIERFKDVHPGHGKQYVLGDILNPFGILAKQNEQIEKEELDRVWDTECRLLPMLLYMRRMGAKIDMVKADNLDSTFTAAIIETLKEATHVAGIRGLELTPDNFSKKDVQVYLFDKLGVEVPRTEPSKNYPNGQPSVTDKWLETLEHPVGKLLAKANKMAKAKGTFVQGYIGKNAIGDRVHCEFHPLRRDKNKENGGSGVNGTVSGRFSSSNPNLQNIPSREKDIGIGKLCRAMFIPEDGMDYFSIDYSQIEFRLLVHAAVVRALVPKSKAKKLWGSKGEEIWERLQAAFKAQEMYQNDATTDFHNMVVALTGLARAYAKNINFGIAFTMGVDKLARELGMIDANGKPTAKAHEVLKQYHDNVPFVKAVGQAMTKEAEHDGFTRTLLGRRTHFELWEPAEYKQGGARDKAYPLEKARAEYGEDCRLKRSMTHKALNCFTQGSGADLMKTAMADAWDAGLFGTDDLILSLTVHDELDGSVGRNPRGQTLLNELNRTMIKALEITVPILTDMKCGADWSKTH